MSGTVDVAGLLLDAITVDEAIERIVARARDGAAAPAYVVKPYVEFAERATRDPALLEVLNGAWLRLADGVALQWAAAYLRAASSRRPGPRALLRSLAGIVRRSPELTSVVPERFAGVSFTLPLLRRCATEGVAVHLVGSPRRQGIDDVAAHLVASIPGLRITGTSPGDDSATAERDLVAALRAEDARIVLVGMGFPRQELLMARTVGRLDRGVLIGEGGTFDYREFGGHLRRAPAPVRAAGLEWAWRLALEPARVRRQLAIPRFVRRIHAAARAR